MKHPWIGNIVFERNNDHIQVAYINILGKENENERKTAYKSDVAKLNSYLDQIKDCEL